jgi:hypothetical protein
MRKTKYTMRRTSMYGHYHIIKTTASGKESRVLTTDSELFDAWNDGKRVQARLKRVFDYLKPQY